MCYLYRLGYNDRSLSFSSLIFSQILINSEWIYPISADLRVLLRWNTEVNVELKVIEPSGECCSCFSNRTKSGGILSRDFTSFGPVEYLNPSAPQGRFLIVAKARGSYEKLVTCVNCVIFTHFGTGNEESVNYTFSLKGNEEKEISQIIFE